eukprot:915491-Pyramimonas_sp.AAC.1
MPGSNNSKRLGESGVPLVKSDRKSLWKLTSGGMPLWANNLHVTSGAPTRRNCDCDCDCDWQGVPSGG